jgi:hypothetical protein
VLIDGPDMIEHISYRSSGAPVYTNTLFSTWLHLRDCD